MKVAIAVHPGCRCMPVTFDERCFSQKVLVTYLPLTRIITFKEYSRTSQKQFITGINDVNSEGDLLGQPFWRQGNKEGNNKVGERLFLFSLARSADPE